MNTSLKYLRIKIYRNRKVIIFPTIIMMFLILFVYKNNREIQNITDVFHEKVHIKLRNPRDLISRVSSEVLNDASGLLVRKLPVSHVFIVNAYYYQESKSLGKNAVALNMVVDSKNFDIATTPFNIVGSNETHEQAVSVFPQTEIVESCRYSPVVAIGNTVDQMSMLELESEGMKIEIPFKLARTTAPKPVIICISPQFVAEQWQMFMLNAHVAYRFGAHLHIYITSIIDSFFELVKEYERNGYVTIDYWLRMKFSESVTPYYEPNTHTEFRNQAGANTDCLLQYKEAAEYIAFFDMDDILFPSIHSSYLREFSSDFSVRDNITSIEYLRTEHEFVKTAELSGFNLYDAIASLKSSKKVSRGAVIVKPSHHNITGIRGSQYDTSSSSRVIEDTSIVHIKWLLQKDHVDNVTRLLKSDLSPFKEKIRPKDIIEIENDIQRMRSLPELSLISRNLPTTDFYFPIVFQCYTDVLALEEVTVDIKKCPNVESCILPQNNDYKCIHSDADYFSGYHMKPFTYHFTNNSFWSYDIGCFQ